jgi:superoxide reductase
MSVQRQEIYKCRVCGIVAEILDAGAGEPICCGQPMTLLLAGTMGDPQQHALSVQVLPDAVEVHVGNPPHPMDTRHFIQWIEVLDGQRVGQQYLQPGGAPEARFVGFSEPSQVRILCNRHGLW